MTSQPLGVCGVRRRAPSLLVGAVLLTALIGVTAPSTAGADTIQSLVAPNGVHATLNNNVLKITNSTDQWVYGVSGDSGGPNLSDVQGKGNNPRYQCGVYPPVPASFLCGFSGDSAPEAPPFARPPGETLRIEIQPAPGVLSRVEVLTLDAKCVNDMHSAYGSFLLPKPLLVPSLTPVRAAKLDECAREALGKPTLTETGAGGGKVGLTINGASAHWATRVFGGHSRKAVRTARSGKTVAKIPASSGQYPPFGHATLTIARSVKFLRATWTKKGETPILGPILRVRR
jgi:hypothetical protein